MPLTAIWGSPYSLWGEAEWGYLYVDPNTFPNIRVLVDWDNDGYINRGAQLTDPLNILSDPLNMLDYQKAVTGSTVTRNRLMTDYGQWYFRTVTGAGTADGAHFGRDTTLAESFKVIPGEAYRLTFWIKGVANYSGGTLSASVRTLPADTALASTIITLTDEYQKVSISFTADTNDVGLSVLKSSWAALVTFDITGFMLTEGSDTPAAFNVGDPTNLYDDITEWALNVTTQNGKAKADDNAIADGLARISLDNSDRIFSPNYTSGPLYGMLLPNRLVKIEVHDPGTDLYFPLWSGFVQEYTAVPGLTGALTAEIEATQGLSRLRSAEISVPIMLETTADEAILEILEGIEWYPPDGEVRWIVGVSVLDGDTVVSGATSFFDTIGVGDTTFEAIGDGWSSGKTRAFNAINEIVSAERGFFWMDRSGKLNFIGQNNFAETQALESVSVDNHLITGAYRYGANLANNVKITYYPKTSLTNTLIWESREVIEVAAGVEDKKVRVQFEQESGKTLSVISTNSFGAAAPNSTFTAIGNPSLVDQSAYVTLSVTVTNDRAEILINNESGEDVDVSIQLRGTAIVSYGGTVYEVLDENSKLQIGTWEYSEDMKLLSNELEAQIYAEYILYTRKFPFGEFENIVIKTRDYSWFERQRDYEVAIAVDISDVQLGVESARHIFVGEKHRWRPLIIETTLITQLLGQFNWWILGTDTLGETTYLGN